MTVELEHTYQPRGTAAEILRRRDPTILVSGPAGTGKSRAQLEKLMLMALMTPGFKGLIVRKTQVSIAGSAAATWEEHVANHLIDVGYVRYYGGSPRKPPAYLFRNGPGGGFNGGSIIALAGIDKPSRIMSTDWDVAYIQEATELDPADWDALSSRLRHGGISFQQIIADCNPDRPDHWLNQLANAGKLTMLHSRHWENPRYYRELRPGDDPNAPEVVTAGGKRWTYTDEGREYIGGRLAGLTGIRRARLFEGLWVAAEGLVYEDEWDPALHLLPNALYPKLRSWRDIPADWTRWWSVDFGHTHPFVLQWWAEDPDGRLFLYREIHHSKRLVEDHAVTALLQVTKVVGEVPARGVLSAKDIRDDVDAGRRAWIEPRPRAVVCDTEDAEGRATLTRHLGMETEPAPKHLGVGETIQAVASRLKPAGDGRPRLFLLRDCVVERDQVRDEAKLPCSTAEEVPGYVWDTTGGKKVKEKPAKDNDDGMDAMRYLVAHRDLGARVGMRWL